MTPRIINCVGQLPYKIQLGSNNDKYKVSLIEGNGPLYSSLHYLSNPENGYEQHIVGWTGELKRNSSIDLSVKDLKLQKKNKDNTADANANANSNQPISDEDPLYLTKEQLQNLNGAIQSKYSKDVSPSNAQIHPVWLLRRNQSSWRNYAENIIWPTFHYILNQSNDGENETNWWYDYVKFNEAYAQKIGEIYTPGDIIWIHDYYLLLLPQLLKMNLQNDDSAPPIITYFHHAPWPSNEYFRCLPRRKQILDGMVGADRITFQNESFARHFVSSCKRLLDSTSKMSINKRDKQQYHVSVYGGDVMVDSLPIGVDKEKLLNDAFTKDIDDKVISIKQAYQDKKIIIGRDRFDSVRGVVQKLRAFETFLAMYPEWRNKVVLIQVSTPTTNKDSPQTIKLEQQVNELVNSINSRYGTLNFSPVQHYYMRIPNDVYYSLMRVADLCLITTVRDGINTTAFEYVTIKSKTSAFNCANNPLILSEFSGSSIVLKDSILINPWDSVAVAKETHKALIMTNEEKSMLQGKLYPQVPTIQNWTEIYLETLNQMMNKSNQNKKMSPALNRPILFENYNSAKRRLFCFDYDGTLTPIVKDPAAAIPTARLYSIIEKLSRDPKNQIWIISGRDQKFLNKWWGSKFKQLGLSAEHGCFIRDVNSDDWINLTEQTDMSWQKKVIFTMEEFVDKTPGSFIEKKKCAIVWHYRRSVPELGEFNAESLKNNLLQFADDYNLEVMEGKANIEVRPRIFNKGEIVKKLIWHKHSGEQDFANNEINKSLPKDSMPDFVLCLGDDATDEDMFRQMNSIEEEWSTMYPKDKNKFNNFGFYPVTVGSSSKQTVAKAHLTDPQQVIETLGLLVGDVSIFQSPGTVDLDTRGHVKNSPSSKKSEEAAVAYAERNGN
ncbi:hypothetical protein TBLA_0F03570 [Henningerozyma blattae CBS 6284]|uniref:Uncharacterized protein n=1 Tax=Henningerozyma blattae (strain ATCC 34711 / CBS 6284 / DSM 70876 / NBRC 10599 / NRRL Y-10934 / UCD 77-7) TaxID=1071380 RepID=I2H692_HENB6|nr:hypothetical protein TBLA_0F03570 [Tetrapisispora blattae CBS 6284]CCH61894.1 hypothetical protein TBLA_0F03570 [Tetrapisispora blattae CBS 6284]